MEETMDWYATIESIEYNLEHVCHFLASNDLKLDNLRQICELVSMEYMVDHTTPVKKYKPTSEVPNAPKKARRIFNLTNA
jgi:hypothetical protein